MQSLSRLWSAYWVTGSKPASGVQGPDTRYHLAPTQGEGEEMKGKRREHDNL